ncbi:hypothetical protein M7I_3918 [Glarea lozoyensis 74030]|uniref:Uncharacterized protein n=1 Tax=Glarea lozoyensis (strain ATCC 74030 / MF5533) TaxID=1104152 RepID=H0EMS3_GLAL7|nr:hypothetical protein M7I_3918 [Glarea lozoyensis 74030]
MTAKKTFLLNLQIRSVFAKGSKYTFLPAGAHPLYQGNSFFRLKKFLSRWIQTGFCG